MTEHPPISLLRTLPVLQRMRKIKGWLSDDEADLLIAGVARALADLPQASAVVEVGSYCGRSTTVLGTVVKLVCPESRVYAVDPHDGEISAVDQGSVSTESTFETFERNIAEANLQHVVRAICSHSYEVQWHGSIAFLLIDGLHDYANVSRDFRHFEPWLADRALAAFHDYGDYFPDVRTFVNELLVTERYTEVDRAGSMIVLRRHGLGARLTAGLDDGGAASFVTGEHGSPT